MAADTVSGYVNALLEVITFNRNTYALDRPSRQDAIDQMIVEAKGLRLSAQGRSPPRLSAIVKPGLRFAKLSGCRENNR